MKEHGGTGGMAPLILNVGTIGSSVVSIHWIGGWVNSRSSLDDLRNIQIVSPTTIG